jgi:hypothetical protein
VGGYSEGSLHVDGQDLGPSTAPVSHDGEYEWFTTVRAPNVRRLVELLGGHQDSDVLAYSLSGTRELALTSLNGSSEKAAFRSSDSFAELHGPSRTGSHPAFPDQFGLEYQARRARIPWSSGSFASYSGNVPRSARSLWPESTRTCSLVPRVE